MNKPGAGPQNQLAFAEFGTVAMADASRAAVSKLRPGRF
jgi:hypothetical protein